MARGPNGTFVAGTEWDGNAGGRPKAVHDVQELARVYTPEAIQALVKALAMPRERVAAASVLLDRGYGKPLQPTHNTTEILHVIAAMSPAERIERAQAAIARIRAALPDQFAKAMDATIIDGTITDGD
jgi:hypothetical protein